MSISGQGFDDCFAWSVVALFGTGALMCWLSGVLSVPAVQFSRFLTAEGAEVRREEAYD